jgi:nicotinamide-nucleotide amidase
MYPQEHDELAHAIGELLVARGSTLAVVETSAGGLISARLLSVAGASRWFERGVIAYTVAAKTEIAPRAASIIGEHGAVSPEFIEELAQRMRERTGADFALAESGIAGPQGPRRSGKPVGSVVIGIASPEGAQIEQHVLPGTRAEVMTHIAHAALESLHRVLAGASEGVAR